MSLFARGISSRLTNAFPFGSAVASRESRYCRVVWSMSLPFYAVVYGPIHIFHCLSNIFVRDCAVVRNAPLWLSIRAINFLDSVKIGFMGVLCRRVLRLSSFFVADGRCRRKPQSSWHGAVSLTISWIVCARGCRPPRCMALRRLGRASVDIERVDALLLRTILPAMVSSSAAFAPVSICPTVSCFPSCGRDIQSASVRLVALTRGLRIATALMQISTC